MGYYLDRTPLVTRERNKLSDVPWVVAGRRQERGLGDAWLRTRRARNRASPYAPTPWPFADFGAGFEEEEEAEPEDAAPLEGEEEGKPKKSLALKVVHHESESDEDKKNEDKDEEVAMITRRIQRFLKKNKTLLRKSFKKFFKKDSSKNDTLIYYKCNKPGHIKPDCPMLKKDRNKGKKAMKATWDDDSSSSDSEASNRKSANLCLMAKDDIKVTNLDNIEDFSDEEL
ncbi:hypothetical protein I3760_08G134000 [Carya illinoinensis]|nr:hypothetical protein I3760_08G134000 [Carya illinoinensis]